MSAACLFCRKPVITGGSAHWRCGGVLPDSEREYPAAAADHFVRVLRRKRRRPRTVQQLQACLRPELRPYFAEALSLALAASRIHLDRNRVEPSSERPRAVSQPSIFDDDSDDGLFVLSEEMRRERRAVIDLRLAQLDGDEIAI